MAVRMKEVAQRAGVSTTTVSHVLNKTRYVSPETRRRVEQAIRELRFYKDARAGRLGAGRSNFFGLIVSDITNPFFPELVRGFESAARERRFDVLLFDTNYDSRRTEVGVRMMIENKVRGVAVMTSELAPHLIEDFRVNHVAVVSLDLGTSSSYTANIRVDYGRGIRQAIDHLHNFGHKEIAFISGPQNLRSARIRSEAFVSALHAYGLTPQRMLEGNHKVEGGVTAARLLLEDGRLPSAILCSNDLTAIGAMGALRDAQLRIPEDISVIGFDDIYFARIATPPLTTVILPRDRVGKLAFQSLQNIQRSKKHKGNEYVIETELVIRESTACLKSSGG